MDHRDTTAQSTKHSPFMTNSGNGSLLPGGSEQLSVQTDVSQCLVNNMPELYYGPSSPPSAESSSMMSTPSYDWYSPLPGGSPQIMSPYTSSHEYPFDQWPPYAHDEFQGYPDYLSHFDKHHSYTPCQRSEEPPTTSSVELMDELNWEKQRNAPEFSPPSNNCYSQGHGDHYTPLSTSHSLSTPYPLSSRQDTHSNQLHTTASFTSSSFSSAFQLPASHNITVSPSMLVLSDTPSTSVLPPSTATQQATPLKLHQPRPSRRIPIISLSQLASASEEVLRKKNLAVSQKQSLSPIPLDCHGFTVAPARGTTQPSSRPYLAPYHPSYHSLGDPTMSLSSQPGRKVITCGCGCSESYTI